MGLLMSLLLLAAGLVGAAPLVLKQFPGLRDTIDSIRRYSSVIGLVLLVSGVWRLLKILGDGLDLKAIAIIVTMIGLGFLQGFEFVMELFRNNEKLVERSRDLRYKLLKYQEALGVVALIVSILSLLKII